MKTALYTLFFQLCVISMIDGQCPSGSLDLKSQDDIINFYTKYPNCQTIDGNLYILNDNTPAITDLSLLNKIITVTGSVRIQNLTSSINGLSSLQTIGSQLVIDGNSSIKSLGSLSSVRSVGNLFITNNTALESLTGLSSLSSVGSVNINANSSLTSISSLTGLREVSSLNISDNSSLSNLTGLNNINKIKGNLSVDGSNITSLTALSSLKIVEGSLSISGTRVSNLSGLGSLTSLAGSLSISGNDELTSLSGLGNIAISSGNEIDISYNSQLSNCAISTVCNKMSSDAGNIYITGNSGACSDDLAVEQACTAKLPVELTFFKGEPMFGVALLKWQTASEDNNDYFQIEHSRDGKSFKAVGRLLGNGTTHEVNNYEYRHLNPSKGVNYYRLKQVDKNLKFEYSNIISVQMGEKSDITVYPNPTKGSLNIIGDTENGIVQIKDSMGKTLMNQEIKTSNNINISNLPKGMYFIEFKNADQSIIKRVIKE